jgi:hypothetical protein
MKHSFLSRLAGGLSLVSLALCLAAALLFFLGRITESTYKRGFLLASIAWFVLAAGRAMAGKDQRTPD